MDLQHNKKLREKEDYNWQFHQEQNRIKDAGFMLNERVKVPLQRS